MDGSVVQELGRPPLPISRPSHAMNVGPIVQGLGRQVLISNPENLGSIPSQTFLPLLRSLGTWGHAQATLGTSGTPYTELARSECVSGGRTREL